MNQPMALTTRRSVIAAAGVAILASASPAIAGKNRREHMLETLKAIITGWHNHDVEAVLAHVTDDIVWRNTSQQDIQRSMLKMLVLQENLMTDNKGE